MRFKLWVFLGVFAVIAPARAVIFYSTGDTNYNTTAPTGSLTNSGWQFQGEWGAYLGTPIAPSYFVSAQHVQGQVGQSIRYQGVNYPTTAVFDDPNSDLRLWRICGQFPDYAPLYTNSSLNGRSFVVLGRGTQRGEEVLVNGSRKGWRLGAGDNRLRWGQNTVSTTRPNQGDGVGPLLVASFDASGGANEAYLSDGDSAGGVFIQESGVWKLAGINYAVDGPFNTTNTGSGFFGAIYDTGGLYVGGAGNWSLRPDLPISQAASFYITPIPANYAWIQSILNQPGGDSSIPAVEVATTVAGDYVEVPGATVDTLNKFFTLPLPEGPRFYRLRSCAAQRIVSIVAAGNTLKLTYE